jgi:hypothetical protein
MVSKKFENDQPAQCAGTDYTEPGNDVDATVEPRGQCGLLRELWRSIGIDRRAEEGVGLHVAYIFSIRWRIVNAARRLLQSPSPSPLYNISPQATALCRGRDGPVTIR